MPTAKKLKSGSWRCQVFSHFEEVTQEDGTVKKKRIYKSFTCRDPSKKGKRICEQMASDWAAEKEQYSQAAPITFHEALEKYIDARSSVLSPATVREYRRSMQRDYRAIDSFRIDAITQEQVQRLINEYALNHSPKSTRNLHGLLSAVMYTYRPGFQLRTDLPKKVRPDLHVPTDDEIRALLDAVRGTCMELPVLLAAFGPMRRSEICALGRGHVHGNIVHVEYAMVRNDSHEWVLKRPKSYAGDRFITFPDMVAEKLRTVETDRITELNPDELSSRFRRLLCRLGLPHFRFHDLRHYSASIQHALGIPDAYIMERGGWGDDSTLKSVYRHTMEQEKEEMNEKANSHFEELCNTKCNTKRKNP